MRPVRAVRGRCGRCRGGGKIQSTKRWERGGGTLQARTAACRRDVKAADEGARRAPAPCAYMQHIDTCVQTLCYHGAPRAPGSTSAGTARPCV